MSTYADRDRGDRVVHATVGGTGTWKALCAAGFDYAYCTLDASQVTCPECLTLVSPVDLVLDLVPLADLVVNLQDQGMHSEAEDLAGALVLMSGKTLEEILYLIDMVALRKHGPTVRLVPAPF